MKYRVSKNVFNAILWRNLLIAIMVLIISFSSTAYLYEDGRSDGHLALGMTNPNLCGMMLECVYSIILIMYIIKKNFNSFLCLAYI